MDRIFLQAAALAGFLGVATGAFGAHALREKLAPEMLAVFQTGVLYQFIHALALVAVAWVYQRAPGAVAMWSGWSFVAGIMLFSGSLYSLALTGIRTLGAVTPLGGLAFLLGWGCLGWAAGRI